MDCVDDRLQVKSPLSEQPAGIPEVQMFENLWGLYRTVPSSSHRNIAMENFRAAAKRETLLSRRPLANLLGHFRGSHDQTKASTSHSLAVATGAQHRAVPHCTWLMRWCCWLTGHWSACATHVLWWEGERPQRTCHLGGERYTKEYVATCKFVLRP